MSIRQRTGAGPRWRRLLAALVVVLAGVATLAAFTLPSLLKPQEPAGLRLPLHTEGSRIVDAKGAEVHMTGINWFGFETGTFSPHGLWAQNYQQMLDQMHRSGFNTIRLPYSNEMFKESSLPTGIDYAKNPDLQGLKGAALMDKIVQGAEKRGMMVVLDQHRPNSQGQSDLWYTGDVSEQQWLNDWVMLAKRYKNNPNVVGADLHNEPKGEATWGDGNPKTDWKLAAEKAGNAVTAANPNMLVLVEGIATYKNDTYWWGGNLQGAGEHPVKLQQPGKVVYSAHDYGPGVYQQDWFKAPNFPANMPAIWDKQFGYLEKQKKAPVLVGEFGGRSVSPNTVEGKWQNALVDYMKQTGMDYTYWTWNPDSGDTGGVVGEDWSTPDQAKLKMLQSYQAPQVQPPKQP
jgi:endoglucanase